MVIATVPEAKPFPETQKIKNTSQESILVPHEHFVPLKLSELFSLGLSLVTYKVYDDDDGLVVLGHKGQHEAGEAEADEEEGDRPHSP